jgi:hypothetical protein
VIALILAACIGCMVAIPSAIRHDDELPISITGKAKR